MGDLLGSMSKKFVVICEASRQSLKLFLTTVLDLGGLRMLPNDFEVLRENISQKREIDAY